MSRKYECVIVLSPTLGEDGITATLEKIKKLFENTATLTDIADWGKKVLAYEIENQKVGFYYLLNFEAEADFPAELERILKITDGVLRYLVVRLDD